jgi:Tol biopolymer transport system component
MSKTVIMAAVVLTAVLSLGVEGPQSGHDLFQKALAAERGDGDLAGAIALYQKVIDGTKDESLAAKAQLRIGICYERLGSREARAAYRRLIAEYPGQKDEVALAKERLSKLESADGSARSLPVFRKVRTPFRIPQWSGGCLSPDGRALVFGSQDVLWTVPIPGNVDPDLAGEPNRLPGTEGTLGQGLAWSGDGRWIAFSRAFRKVGGGYIRFDPSQAYIDVVPASGGAPKRLAVPQWTDSQGASYRELSISPGGRKVAFDAKGQLYVASVETGEIVQLTRDGGMVPSFSPDGKKIAYVTPVVMGKDPALPYNELRLMPASGGDPVKVSGDTRQLIRSALWSPDGRMIAYLRHHPSTKPTSEVCFVALSDDGKPLGAPAPIKLPLFSRERMAGWTPDHKIGFLFEIPFQDYVYTVPASGGKASQVSPLEGLADHPQWTPDGKRIFFRWEDGRLASVPSEGGELAVHPSLQGAMRSGFFSPYPAGGNCVSPDGRSVVISAGTVGSNMQIWTVPVGGGEPKRITGGEGHRFPCWSPDGKWIACLGSEIMADKKDVTRIFKVPAEGGEARKITDDSAKVAWADLDWSPDGRSIAYFSKDSGDVSAGTLNVIPVDGGAPRTVCRVDEVSGHSDVAWSPDGRSIAFVSLDKIWIVPAEGGEPVELKTDVEAEALELDWSPDGTKIAFSGRSGWNKEFWFMEDFLQKLKE